MRLGSFTEIVFILQFTDDQEPDAEAGPVKTYHYATADQVKGHYERIRRTRPDITDAIIVRQSSVIERVLV